MALKNDKSKKEQYFNLSEKDRLYFELEDEEKNEKAAVAEKVFKKFNEKQTENK
ncbi:hypothetical protein [Sediminibacillus massiliensis]|uniref:hypothetical protein n=1 Tax=Sediminibacillus massiliensis TaxID=1926277 RepID=UPI0015C2E3DC|nr:hypothetical protein [Sediminibacillus massiliensis]